jgi:hypothetical protein
MDAYALGVVLLEGLGPSTRPPSEAPELFARAVAAKAHAQSRAGGGAIGGPFGEHRAHVRHLRARAHLRGKLRLLLLVFLVGVGVACNGGRNNPAKTLAHGFAHCALASQHACQRRNVTEFDAHD